VTSYNFSAWHQFCWCCHTYSHPAINSSCTSIHLVILPSILLVLPYIFSSCHHFWCCCHTSSHLAINSDIYLLILPSNLLVLPYIFSSCTALSPSVHFFCHTVL
jgi:hypothetical protein